MRATALGALGRAGALELHHLAAALSDPEPTVRRRAAEEAARAPAAVVASLDLAPLLSDPDAFVAEAVAFALGELDPSPAGAVDALATAATGHEDVLVREAAVAALGSLGDERGLEAVLAGCHDIATIRRRAVLALAAFDGPAVEAMLRDLSTDRDRQVRQAAEDLLQGWGSYDDHDDPDDPDDPDGDEADGA
ncbi:MAG: HEAT repeat domain-containing protein [Acidimicrobiia bacterium]|nr:HEAT repeat domain-containing protein [Acidimicrobiia bacterium]